MTAVGIPKHLRRGWFSPSMGGRRVSQHTRLLTQPWSWRMDPGHCRMAGNAVSPVMSACCCPMSGMLQAPPWEMQDLLKGQWLRLCLHSNRITRLNPATAARPDTFISLATSWMSLSMLPSGRAEPGIPAGSIPGEALPAGSSTE